MRKRIFSLMIIVCMLLVVCHIPTEAKKKEVSFVNDDITITGLNTNKTYKVILKDTGGKDYKFKLTNKKIRITKIKKGKNKTTVYYKVRKHGVVYIDAYLNDELIETCQITIGYKPDVNFYGTDTYVYGSGHGKDYYIAAWLYLTPEYKYTSGKKFYYTVHAKAIIASAIDYTGDQERLLSSCYFIIYSNDQGHTFVGYHENPREGQSYSFDFDITVPVTDEYQSVTFHCFMR